MKYEFLKEKYELQKSPEVERAAKRIEKHAGKKLPLRSAEDAEARIQNYLDRFKEITSRKNSSKQERGMEALKRILYNKFIIKPEEIPEAYFESIKRRHREEGRPLEEIPEDIRRELAQDIIIEQKHSLDNWIDYLALPDAKYPDVLKYWAIRNILKLGRYDKKKQKFSERYGGTISSFPDLNREALALVLNAMEGKYAKQPFKFGYDIKEETRQKFLELLEKENFAKLYALAIEEFKPISEDLLKITKGRWVKYPQGSDYRSLVDSLGEYGTGWCIRGEAMAQRYLKENDLEIFYSWDKNGKPTVPRIVIVSNNDDISEVRGVAEDEHHDPYISDVVEKKLAILPDGKRFEKKNHDMKQLTRIERKTIKKEALTKDELVFLYEIDAPIEGFGYRRDPRIAELRGQQNPEEDMPIIFECAKNQIARAPSEIHEGTRVYVGKLAPGIFDAIQQYNIEHIYTAFPEGRIRKETIEIGGKNAEALIKEMHEEKINISGYGMNMLKSKDFKVAEETEEAILILLKVGDLGFPKGKYPTTDEIYKRAEELGMELCPAEVGPHYRLRYKDQPLGEWLRIGMKQITDRGGCLHVFDLVRCGDGLWLYSRWTGPTGGWGPDIRSVFRLRKLRNLKT